MKKSDLEIEGMHCASCSTLISRALMKKEGVSDANVNVATNKATIKYDDSKINEKELIKVIIGKGYGAKTSLGNNDAGKKAQKEYKKLKERFYISLVFAIPVFILGMFFMKDPIPYQNIMMWILSTPVQFFIAASMYKSTFAALKGKTANMDTLIAGHMDVSKDDGTWTYQIDSTSGTGLNATFTASASGPIAGTITCTGGVLAAK